jgi:hypothetical protein
LVQQPGRQPPEHEPEQLDREALHVAPQNIRWRAYRDPHPCRAALGKIDGNLCAAVARTNNQYVLIPIGLRVAVLHRMNHRSIECARPSRHMWKTGKSGGHYDHPRRYRASIRPDAPVTVIAVNTRGINPEAWLEAMVRRVHLQVLHELVACHPAAKIRRNPVARKMRQRSDRMQVQTVVAAPPRLPHTPTLNDGGGYAPRPQCRRSRQTRRTSTDDDDVLHSQRLLLR